MRLLIAVRQRRVGIGFLMLLLEATLLVRVAVTFPPAVSLVLGLDVVTTLQAEATCLEVRRDTPVPPTLIV